MDNQDFVDTQPPAEPAEADPVTTEAPVTSEAPEVPAPAADVAGVAGANVTHVVERRSFGRPSPNDPMVVTQHTGV